MSGYRPRRRPDAFGVLKERNKEQERGEYPAILSEPAWIIRDLLYGIKTTLFLRVTAGNSERQDRAILPIRGASHIIMVLIISVRILLLISVDKPAKYDWNLKSCWLVLQLLLLTFSLTAKTENKGSLKTNAESPVMFVRSRFRSVSRCEGKAVEWVNYATITK